MDFKGSNRGFIYYIIRRFTMGKNSKEKLKVKDIVTVAIMIALFFVVSIVIGAGSSTRT